MQRPDVRAIRQLTAVEVADRLDLFDSQAEGVGASARYRFKGYDGSYWIQLLPDGAWQDHKHDQGGDALSLVMAYVSGPPAYDARDESSFMEAARMIAAAFGLWETVEAERRQSRQLAAAAPPADDAYAWLARQVDLITRGLGGEPWAQVCRLCDALGVDPEVLTLCPYPQGGSGALCWQPAAPWQGVTVSTKLGDDGRTVYGGWTKERLKAHAGEPGSLRLFVLDLDGHREKQHDGSVTTLLPRASDVQRLVYDLGKRGLPVAAHVWTTFEGEGANERAKAHLYFVASRQASTPEQWLAWWSLIGDTVEAIVAGWDVPADERRAFKLDDCAHQLTRLIRLPGYAKYGRPDAAVIASLDELARVDFARLAQTRDLSWSYTQDDGSMLTVTLGHECHVTKVSADGGKVERQLLGRGVWPLARYHTEGGLDHGVYLRLEPMSGAAQYLALSAASFVDKRGQMDIARALASRGANVNLRRTGALAAVIGDAYSQGRLRAAGQLVSRSGWHGDTYVQGTQVLGPAAIYPDPQAGGIARRSATAGDTASWRAEVVSRCTTPALKLALGVSLAGAMIRRVGAQPFILHVAGPSSIGKSTVAHVAASVWGPPTSAGVYQTWDATARAFEGLAELAQDGCLILDELGRYEGAPEQLRQVIHTLGSSSGRARARVDGGLQEARGYYLATVSTGEVGLGDTLGGLQQGGHLVRALDLPVVAGETSETGLHADQVRAACKQHHGAAALTWAAHLASLPDEWRDVRAQLHTEQLALEDATPGEVTGETSRVLGIVALITVALAEAHRAGLVPWGADERRELALWAAARIIGERTARREDTPERRALHALLRYVALDEGHAPTLDRHGELSTRLVEPVGIRTEGDLLINEEWLKHSPVCAQAGINARAWLRWAREEGLILEQRMTRFASYRKRLWVLSDDRVAAYLDEDRAAGTDASVPWHRGKDTSVPPKLF